jgi:hypothetical protein
MPQSREAIFLEMSRKNSRLRHCWGAKEQRQRDAGRMEAQHVSIP